MRHAGIVLLAAWVGLGLAGAEAQETEDQDAADELPELDFLEYLGSWQEDDEEWLVVEDWEPERDAAVDGRPEPEGEDGDDE